MSAWSYVIFCAAEDRTGMEVASELAEKILADEVPWLADQEEAPIQWRGYVDAAQQRRSWFDLHSYARVARECGLRRHGHFDGRPGLEDAHMFRSLLAIAANTLAELQAPDRVAAVFVRDMDGRAERLEGFEQALQVASPAFPVLLAAPDPEIEAWLVAGFVPDDEREQLLVDKLKEELSFDPTREPHRLVSTHQGNPRDAKRISEELLEGADKVERRRRCIHHLASTPHSGCQAEHYVDQVRRKLIPLFT